MPEGLKIVPQPIDRLKIATEMQLRWQAEAGLPTDRVICPLCWNLELGVVTSDEHIFPRCIDGRHRMITCESCNNQRGSKQDSQLGLELDQHRAMTSDVNDRSINVELLIGDSRLTANMQSRRPGYFDLVIVENKRATNPADLESSKKHMTSGGHPKIKIRHRTPHPVKVNQAVLKSCYLAASMFFGYSWSRAVAPDYVRRIGVGQIAPPEVDTLAYRFPTSSMLLEDKFMIGKVSELELIMVTFPMGKESAYFRSALLPFLDQTVEQYLSNARNFAQNLQIGNNSFSYDWCFTFDSMFEILQLFGECTAATKNLVEIKRSIVEN